MSSDFFQQTFSGTIYGAVARAEIATKPTS